MQVIFLMHVAVWKNGITTPKKKCFTGFCAVKPKNHMFCYNVVSSVLTRWVVIYHYFRYNWFTLIFLHLFRNLLIQIFYVDNLGEYKTKH